MEGPQTLPAYIPGLLPSLINPPLGCRFHPRCKYAWQLCVDQEPGLDPVGADHFAACHLNTTTPPPKEATCGGPRAVSRPAGLPRLVREAVGDRGGLPVSQAGLRP